MTTTIDCQNLVTVPHPSTESQTLDQYIVVYVTLVAEISDKEWSELPYQSGTFNFWNDPREDIYNPNDGQPTQ